AGRSLAPRRGPRDPGPGARPRAPPPPHRRRALHHRLARIARHRPGDRSRRPRTHRVSPCATLGRVPRACAEATHPHRSPTCVPRRTELTERTQVDIFRTPEDIPADRGPAVITIGNFDGVHRGHAVVLDALVSAAASRGLRSVVVTFDPHPRT